MTLRADGFARGKPDTTLLARVAREYREGTPTPISTSYSITLASTVCILYVNVYYVVYNIIIIIIVLASSNIYSTRLVGVLL